MPTMKDVANRAGVSLGTVSNVLNNRATVLPANRARVLQAVEELGFRANMLARALKTKSSMILALVIPDINNPFYPEFARGVEDAANRAGYQVFFCNSDRSHVKELRYIESLLQKNIDGLIVVKPQMNRSELEEINRQLALVLVDSDVAQGGGFSVINVDDEGGMRMGLALLRENGHERIALISGLMESLSSHVRVETYKAFLAQEGFPFRREYVTRGDYAWASGYKSAKVFMALPTPPTAIFAANDLMAMGCIRALHDMGLWVPGDVSVLGYDNIDMAKLCTPALTSVNQPKYDFGMNSAQMLLRRLEAMHDGQQPQEEAVLLPLHIAVRESVGPAKGSAQAAGQEDAR